MATENEKMEHEYTHQFDQYMQEQFYQKNKCMKDAKNNLKDNKHICDIIHECVDGWNVVKDLVSQGQSVVTSHSQIENNHFFVIEKDLKIFLIRNDGKENVRLRELTEDEYRIARTIYE